MERFENAIFKQREEINDRMTEMFRLLKELTTSKTPKKHDINKKLIEGLVDNHRFNDFLSRARAGKTKRKTYNISPKGPVYEAILRKRITRKEDIGGNFKIPCNIGGQKGINALVDQGSDVNIMPYTTYMKLTDERPAETDIRLSLASHSYIYPLGIAEDVLVDVAEHIEKGVKNDIEPIAPIMTVNRLVLEWEERIKLHIEKEMKFNQWRSNNFKSKHPAPVKVEVGMDDEREVTFDEKLGSSKEVSLDDSWRTI
ncbi:hypothetical protein Tco_0408342 [Tanacetum coccineum]